MKILLISPAKDLTVKTNKGLMMPQLALYIIQGLTPPQHSVRIIEEEYMKLDMNEDADLVGISCMTANSTRAYELGDYFRKKGKKVILGGVHPTILPDEAAEHADAVVVGEAEGVWKELLTDIEQNQLKKRYHCPSPDLTEYVPKSFSTLKSRRLFNILPLMTTRGCPYDCDFCCVNNLFGKKVRHIPVPNIVRDIVESKSKNFIFLDDNIIGNPKYAKELFTSIKPLKIKWIGQASISFVKDLELMNLAVKSGCKGLFIGLESVCETQMKSFKKSMNTITDLEKALRKIRSMGIFIQASMIFGFDNDTPETFKNSLKFLVRNKISAVSFNVLTPYPGTRTFEKMKKEGRLLHQEWKQFDHNTVVFRPQNMTPFELQKGKTLTRRKFYSPGSILYRFWGNLQNPVIYMAMNYAHVKQSKIEYKRLKTLKHQMQ